MFYKMIESRRNQWLLSDQCAVNNLISYMETKGQMRDAQIEAIKTFIFLKIACGCKPLSELFCTGEFNTLDLDETELTSRSRAYLKANPAAAALYEYALLPQEDGTPLSKKIAQQIVKNPEEIDCRTFFQQVFYGVSYSDYLFSLPMGAGKTFLMAAFIYLDLYFALNEPHNPAFAHNFIVFAPSGLKSSVVPSLKTIQNFDPSWVIPEPAASNIKRRIAFEVLDQGKTASKSNKTKNPNVQKIANHQPLSELFGLVAVTNAEKVILDRIEEKKGQISMYEDSDDERDRKANELRNLIGKLPSLSIFIDEVHHAVSDEIKLRAVVNRWARNDTINSVIGFSGTPYLEKPEKIQVREKLRIATAEITNIVYYYPLIEGIGNFLKCPVVKIAQYPDSARIIERGVREFLDSYKDRRYTNGTTAKLGIYCGTIEKLEEMVYPLVSRIVSEYGLNTNTILKFHRGDSKKKYPQPADSQMLFDTLDSPTSNIRIVLLVQIGKEGWDCRSLTGIILSQEGDCPKNMVLQTSCRCLRQVDKGRPESALIYLNDSNAEKLNAQLQQQQHTTLKEFSRPSHDQKTLKRYDRTKYLKLPKIDFYQLRVQYNALEVEAPAPEEKIPDAAHSAYADVGIIKETDLSMKPFAVRLDQEERGSVPATYYGWLYEIVKGSFGSLSMGDLKQYSELLEKVFHQITYEKDGILYFSSRYNHPKVMANVRRAFGSKRTFSTENELIPESASLLNIRNFTEEILTSKPEIYYPDQETVEKIIQDDEGQLKLSEQDAKLLEMAESNDYTDIVRILRRKYTSHTGKDRSFHYLPYRTDSSFEMTFLEEVLSFREMEEKGLEVYYNGDRALTEFKIKCYQSTGTAWRYVGMYTPDFLIIQRRDGKIYKAVVVETKGQIYANDPTFRVKKSFMESEFLRQNNQAFGYDRFDFLYLEDTMSAEERMVLTHDKICEFYKE